MKLAFAITFMLLTAAAAQWEKMDVPTSASLRGLSVVSAAVIWASGTDGTVIRTADGGKHWSVRIVPGAEKLDFRGIRAFDEKTAIIISSGPAEKGQARIYRTTDGGAVWKLVFEEQRAGVFFDAVAFWDRRHGIVLSDPVDGRFALYTTEDTGATWKQLPPAVVPPALPNEGAFAASNSCLTVQGENNAWFATGGASVARVFRSNDRGQSWSVAETPMRPANASSGIFSLAFQDARHGVAVGGDYAHPESSDLPNVLVTSDSGGSWQAGAGTKPAGMYLSSAAVMPDIPGLASTPERNFVAVGPKGILHSLIALPPDMHVENINSVAVTRPSAHGARMWEMWFIGAKGSVVRTTIGSTFNP